MDNNPPAFPERDIKSHPCWIENDHLSHRVYCRDESQPHFCERCGSRLNGGRKNPRSHKIKDGFPVLWGDGWATMLSERARRGCHDE